MAEVTPEEKWSNHKPSIAHLRTFGCIGFVMIPYEKRIKLDEKSVKCVLMGVGKESKAYMMYNPYTEKIIISKDVKFDESKGWDWEESKQESEPFWEGLIDESEEEGEVNEGVTLEDDGANESDTIPQETEVGGIGEGSTSDSSTHGATGRVRKAPVWMKDYTAGQVNFIIEEEEESITAFFTTSGDP